MRKQSLLLKSFYTLLESGALANYDFQPYYSSTVLANGSATTLANYFLLITEATIQTVSPFSLCWLRHSKQHRCSEMNYEHVAQ